MTRTDEIAARLAGAQKANQDLTRGPAECSPFDLLPEEYLFHDLAQEDVEWLLAENARLRAVVKALTATVTRYETILHEETAAARELAALLESAALGDAERLRAAEARLERAMAEREGVQG